MTTPKSAVAGMLALVTLLPVANAFAQDNTGPIGEIIVTAERREAALQDVPLAVSAVTNEQIEKQQIREAQDLQRIVPSLHMFNNVTTPQNLSLSLRGGLQQDASLVTAESPVGIYVDDVFVGRLNNNNTTLSDIDRVEVLRGPQGTLYGRNTAYGAIKYISRTPGADNSWSDFTIGAGNYDQLLAKMSIGGAISDKWGASFAAQYKEKGDEFTNIAQGVNTGDEENISARAKLHYDGDASDVVISYSWSRSENDSLQMLNGITPDVPSSCPCDPGEIAQFTTDDLVFPNGEYNTNPVWNPDIQPSPLRGKPQSQTTQGILGLTWTVDIGENLQAKYIAGLVSTKDFFDTDFSGNTAASGPTTFYVLGGNDSRSTQFTQELQFLGNAFSDRLDWIAGFFYLNEDADQSFGWNLAGFVPISQSHIDTSTESYAFFGEAGFHFTDRLKVTAGARWTEDSKSFLMDFTPLLIPGPEESIPLDNDSSEMTPKVGIDYQITDDMLAYAQAARGFKGGGFSAIALFSSDPVGAYNSETNWTYEAGFKADWLGQRLRTNLAYFFSDISDIQQNATDTSSGSLEFPVENSGDAEIQGLEFEITAVPIDGLTLFLNGALMDGKYKNLNENSAAFASTELYGVQPETPQTPDYTVSVGADYTFDMPGDLFGDFAIGADYYKIDNYITSATNDFNNSGWDIWNAYISQDFGDGFTLKLSGKNMADDFIVTSGSRGLGGFIVLPPREVLLSITYKYGG